MLLVSDPFDLAVDARIIDLVWTLSILRRAVMRVNRKSTIFPLKVGDRMVNVDSTCHRFEAEMNPNRLTGPDLSGCLIAREWCPEFI